MTSAQRPDDGFSLIEVLVAVALLGIAVAAILGGMMTSLLATDVHRKQATGETVLRSYAEATKSHAQANYAPCATTYTPAYTAPAGFSATTPVPVSYRSGATWVNASETPLSGCTATSDVVQMLDITVASDDGRSVESTQIVVRRP